ncbi:MAG: hypothetical protein JRF56_14470 [Deltaproteobacteria bacterium]|nr:hypothetical protein [Deltaproteobacteria bacterium]
MNHSTFRIIHPFHPLKNAEFEIDAIMTVPGERRVFFYNHKGRRSSVDLAYEVKSEIIQVLANITLLNLKEAQL